LLGQLAAKNKFPAFRQYYLSLKDSNKAAFQSASLTEATVNLAHPAAGWQAVESVGVGGAFSQPDARGRFFARGICRFGAARRSYAKIAVS
jgi:hypothetical protein